MKNIILSSGITGIDWPASIDSLVTTNNAIGHFDNVMLSTKGKYDDLVVAETENEPTHKKLKPQFKGYLTRLLKGDKSQISFLSDPIFLDSGAAWQTLNEDKSFAFFFCSPEYYLAKIKNATSNGEIIDQQECLDNWQQEANKIWDFYVRYPDNTLLINLEDVERQTTACVSTIFDFIGCELNNIKSNQQGNNLATAVKSPTEKLQFLLLQNIKLETIKDASQLNELYENLSLASILTDDALTYHVNERAMSTLSECQDLSAVITARQLQLEAESVSLLASNSESMADNEKLRNSVSQIESQNTKLKVSNEQTETRFLQLETQHSQLEIELSEQTSENELALLQTTQLQEELKATILKSTELSALNAQLETRTAVLVADSAKLAKRNSQSQISLTQLTSENELALLQINQLQEELEATFLKSTELAALNGQLEMRTSVLMADNAKLATDKSQSQAKFTDLISENELVLLQIKQMQEELEVTDVNFKALKAEIVTGTSESETSLTNLTAENELALLQINQLQEELEHYYIQYQKMTYSPNKIITYASDLNRVKHSLSLMNMN